MQIVFFLLLVGNSRMVQCRGGEMLSIVEYIYDMLTVGRCGVNYIGFCCRFDLGILMELIAGSLRWCTYHFFWTLGIMWICCGQVFVNISD